MEEHCLGARRTLASVSMLVESKAGHLLRERKERIVEQRQILMEH